MSTGLKGLFFQLNSIPDHWCPPLSPWIAATTGTNKLLFTDTSIAEVLNSFHSNSKYLTSSGTWEKFSLKSFWTESSHSISQHTLTMHLDQVALAPRIFTTIWSKITTRWWLIQQLCTSPKCREQTVSGNVITQKCQPKTSDWRSSVTVYTHEHPCVQTYYLFWVIYELSTSTTHCQVKPRQAVPPNHILPDQSVIASISVEVAQ